MYLSSSKASGLAMCFFITLNKRVIAVPVSGDTEENLTILEGKCANPENIVTPYIQDQWQDTDAKGPENCDYRDSRCLVRNDDKWAKKCMPNVKDCIKSFNDNWSSKNYGDGDTIQIGRDKSYSPTGALVVCVDPAFSASRDRQFTDGRGNFGQNDIFTLGACLKVNSDDPGRDFLDDTARGTCTWLIKPSDEYRGMKDEDRKSFYTIKWSELKEAVLASFEPAQDNGTRCDTFQWKTRLYSEGSKVAPLELHVANTQRDC